MAIQGTAALTITGQPTEFSDKVLTPEALEFVARLEQEFGGERRRLLARRRTRLAEIEKGASLGFLAETADVRRAPWTVAPAPRDLDDRRVEITGPADRKMMINALNSGAKVFMADLEDALSPTWENVVDGQWHLYEAVRGTLAFATPEKSYALGTKLATLVVRPRGWHLTERNVLFEGRPISASLFDFGLYFFHNAKERLDRGTGPYFYLPKLESYLEARLWNDVFDFSQDALGIPRGSVRATVLIETIWAAFEMEEILYELRDHAAGLNAGRWDYLFSVIKTFRNDPSAILPDRAQLTMTVPFMRAYTELLVRTCHQRGAHAIGGMAAFVPNRRDPEVTAQATQKVREDKERESRDGFDGTWVAHPDLVPLAREVFDGALGNRVNQKHRLRDDVAPDAAALQRFVVPGGCVTVAGVRTNIDVALRYIEAWLRGTGAVAIHNLMEDAATAEISRSQLWQWRQNAVGLDDDGTMSATKYERIRAEVVAGLKAEPGMTRLAEAAQLLDRLVLGPFQLFLDRTGQRAAEVGSDDNAGDDMTTTPEHEIQALDREWSTEPRWQGVHRDYAADEVVKLRGSMRIEHTLARHGAERLWELLAEGEPVRTFGAMTGAQAVEMVRAGLKAIYLSGWQVAADANLAGQTYPDQSLYPSNSVPALVRRLNNALLRADQVEWSEGQRDREWMVPIVADAEAGFGGPLHAFELTKSMIEAGAAGVHFEDQLASEKKCGHMGGKVLVPTSQFLRTLRAARLAADVLDVPTVIVARTDALAATLLTSDVDEADRRFVEGERTAEGYYRVTGGIDSAISRGVAYAKYADLVWCETSTPDLAEAARFAEGIHDKYPGKMLAYNCSPSFNWERKLDAHTIARFQRELGAMGYKFQFITLAGWHLINYHTFDLAQTYAAEGMPAYVRLQRQEFAREQDGYTATKHQREAGTGYFDQVLTTITGGESETAALSGSTEAEQFGSEKPALTRPVSKLRDDVPLKRPAPSNEVAR